MIRTALSRVGLPTAVVGIVVTIIGGIVTIVHPADLSFGAYLRDVGFAWGLLGIGHGIDQYSAP